LRRALRAAEIKNRGFLDRVKMPARQFVASVDVFAGSTLALATTARALDYLEKSFDEKSTLALLANVDPLIQPLKGDSRFREIIGRLQSTSPSPSGRETLELRANIQIHRNQRHPYALRGGGSGPLVLLLHGFRNRGTPGASDRSIGGRRFHVVAPDLRGYGQTDRLRRWKRTIFFS